MALLRAQGSLRSIAVTLALAWWRQCLNLEAAWVMSSALSSELVRRGVLRGGLCSVTCANALQWLCKEGWLQCCWGVQGRILAPGLCHALVLARVLQGVVDTPEGVSGQP